MSLTIIGGAGHQESAYTAGVRFLYGLRRTDKGELFFGRLDQFNDNDSLSVNKPGDVENQYNDFVEGQDFFEGRDVDHELLYDNLTYEQYRWDNRNIYYYVNDEGELVARVNQKQSYTDTDSSDGTQVYD